MKEILSYFDKLKSKYNFTCELLLDGLYSNQKYKLSESHESGPFEVEVKNSEFAFLSNKIFNTLNDITREIFIQQIKLLSNDNENNLRYIEDNCRFVFRCPHCDCFGKSKITNMGLTDITEPTQNVIYNIYILEIKGCSFSCSNCKKKLLSPEKDNFIGELSNISIDKTRLVIYSSSGGRISQCYTKAIITPLEI